MEKNPIPGVDFGHGGGVSKGTELMNAVQCLMYLMLKEGVKGLIAQWRYIQQYTL